MEMRKCCRSEAEAKEVVIRVGLRRWQLKGILTKFRVDEESPNASSLRILGHPE